VLDLETSGLSSGEDRILQIGVVTVELGPGRSRIDSVRETRPVRIVDEWSTLVRLGWPLRSVGPTDIHGLRRRDLLTARSARSALLELRNRLDGTIPVAHNARFDAAFLANAARRHHVDLGIDRFLCTLGLARLADPDRTSSHRLVALCERHGVTLVRPHDALEDARAAALVLPHLIASSPNDWAEDPSVWVDFDVTRRSSST
jgi:DNA polymerase-3 subunit epsilon